MTEKGIATRMARAIYDYIYEEGENKLSLAETIGMLELVKFDLIEDTREVDNV